MRLVTLTTAIVVASSFLAAQQLPRAIYTDSSRDSTHPARMQILHIPSGGVKINGVIRVDNARFRKIFARRF
jgi:hypothetical protein